MDLQQVHRFSRPEGDSAAQVLREFKVARGSEVRFFHGPQQLRRAQRVLHLVGYNPVAVRDFSNLFTRYGANSPSDADLIGVLEIMRSGLSWRTILLAIDECVFYPGDVQRWVAAWGTESLTQCIEAGLDPQDLANILASNEVPDMDALRVMGALREH